MAYEDFEKVDVRCGTVVRVEPFPRARKPAFKVWVDFGDEIGILSTSAQVTKHYAAETLVGKRVIGCVNMGEKNIAGFLSQFLLLGFPDAEGAIVLPKLAHHVPNGARMC